MNDVRMSISVPAELRKYLKVKAAENDRSLSGEIVRALKIGSGWMEAQKENGLGAATPKPSEIQP